MSGLDNLKWTPIEDVTSYAQPIRGTVTGKPERRFACKVTDMDGDPHYFEVPESQWKLMIKQLQALVGDGE